MAHVVIVVANLPFARDHRVQKQARSLLRAGFRVSVICPRSDSALPDDLRAVSVRAYLQPFGGSGVASFTAEFAWSFLAVAAKLVDLLRRGRVDVVQFCNPPDVFFPMMWVLRLRRTASIFDEHDLAPELYESRGQPHSILYRALCWMQRRSQRAADAVLSMNESYRDVALDRGGLAPERVVVVRNGPVLANIVPRTVTCRPGHRHRIVYVGVMGEQDGVEAVVEAADHLRAHGPDDWDMVLVGDGETAEKLRRRTVDLDLESIVRFTGWLDQLSVADQLAEACLGIQPDPRSPHAEISTMVKTTEYLAYGLPVVSVDLLETRRTAGDAAVFVPEGTPDQLANALRLLLDDDDERRAMAGHARDRVSRDLSWESQEGRYVALIGALVVRRRRAAAGPPEVQS